MATFTGADSLEADGHVVAATIASVEEVPEHGCNSTLARRSVSRTLAERKTRRRNEGTMADEKSESLAESLRFAAVACADAARSKATDSPGGGAVEPLANAAKALTEAFDVARRIRT